MCGTFHKIPQIKIPKSNMWTFIVTPHLSVGILHWKFGQIRTISFTKWQLCCQRYFRCYHLNLFSRWRLKLTLCWHLTGSVQWMRREAMLPVYWSLWGCATVRDTAPVTLPSSRRDSPSPLPSNWSHATVKQAMKVGSQIHSSPFPYSFPVAGSAPSNLSCGCNECMICNY